MDLDDYENDNPKDNSKIMVLKMMILPWMMLEQCVDISKQLGSTIGLSRLGTRAFEFYACSVRTMGILNMDARMLSDLAWLPISGIAYFERCISTPWMLIQFSYGDKR